MDYHNIRIDTAARKQIREAVASGVLGGLLRFAGLLLFVFIAVPIIFGLFHVTIGEVFQWLNWR
jgi:hypothetical protein